MQPGMNNFDFFKDNCYAKVSEVHNLFIIVNLFHTPLEQTYGISICYYTPACAITNLFPCFGNYACALMTTSTRIGSILEAYQQAVAVWLPLFEVSQGSFGQRLHREVQRNAWWSVLFASSERHQRLATSGTVTGKCLLVATRQCLVQVTS